MMDKVGNYAVPHRPAYGGGYEQLDPSELLANGDEANVEIETSCCNCSAVLGVDYLPRAELDLYGWDEWIAAKIGYHLCAMCKGEYPEGAKEKYGYFRLVVCLEKVPAVHTKPTVPFHDGLDTFALDDAAIQELHRTADDQGLDCRTYPRIVPQVPGPRIVPPGE